jgi:hypothetical protein
LLSCFGVLTFFVKVHNVRMCRVICFFPRPRMAKPGSLLRKKPRQRIDRIDRIDRMMPGMCIYACAVCAVYAVYARALAS